MSEGLNRFDFERYMKQKFLKILDNNKGVKLSDKTLDGLAHAGFRLVPPVHSDKAGL